MKYRFIDEQKKAWSTSLMCGVLSVSRRGYNDWTARGLIRRVRSNRALDKRIRRPLYVIGHAMVRPRLPRPTMMRASSAARTSYGQKTHPGLWHLKNSSFFNADKFIEGATGKARLKILFLCYGDFLFCWSFFRFLGRAYHRLKFRRFLHA